MGFSCGDGWFEVIRELSEAVEPLIVQFKLDYPGQDAPKATTIKEKYGTLRFYMNCATDEMWEHIEHAEWRTNHICEICGRTGNYIKPRKIKGWILTYCWAHALQRWIKRTFMLKGWMDI